MKLVTVLNRHNRARDPLNPAQAHFLRREIIVTDELPHRYTPAYMAAYVDDICDGITIPVHLLIAHYCFHQIILNLFQSICNSFSVHLQSDSSPFSIYFFSLFFWPLITTHTNE